MSATRARAKRVGECPAALDLHGGPRLLAHLFDQGTTLGEGFAVELGQPGKQSRVGRLGPGGY